MAGKTLLLIALLLVIALPSGSQADPPAVETKSLTSPAADPFVGLVSVGPMQKFEPIYRVLEPGACPVPAHRVLILDYTNYDSVVVEEPGLSGSKCLDRNVTKSWSINGVTLGYALGEDDRFAWNLEFKG